MTPGPDRERVIRGLEENLWSFWERFGRAPGCALHKTEFATWYETPIPIIPYNTIIRFVSDSDTKERVDKIMAQFQERAVTPAWILHPTARPADLHQLLVDRGLAEVEVAQGMAMPLSSV